MDMTNRNSGPSRGSEGSLSEIDGASLNTGSTRYRRLERPSSSPPPPPPKIEETPPSPPPQYTSLSPIIYNHPALSNHSIPPEEIKRPSSVGFDFDFNASSQNQNRLSIETSTDTTSRPCSQYHALADDATSTPSSTDISRAESFHQHFWDGEEGARRGSTKSVRVLGLGTSAGNNDTLSPSETWPSRSPSSELKPKPSRELKPKPSRSSRAFRRGDVSNDF